MAPAVQTHEPFGAIGYPVNLRFEQEITQNPALGALALWQFSRADFDERGHTEGPELPETLLVLPMVLHQRTARTIHRMQAASGLMKALYDQPEIPAGLQLRVESLGPMTLDALAVGLACSLIELDRADPWPRYVPLRRELPREIAPVSNDVRQIVAAAQRLGRWFAREDFATLCSRLHVRL